MDRLEEKNAFVDCVACTTISIALSANEEKKVVTLPFKFSDFANVFQKPENFCPPHQPFNHTTELDNSFVSK